MLMPGKKPFLQVQALAGAGRSDGILSLLNESGYSLLGIVAPVLNAAEGACDPMICRGDAAVTWIAEPEQLSRRTTARRSVASDQ